MFSCQTGKLKSLCGQLCNEGAGHDLKLRFIHVTLQLGSNPLGTEPSVVVKRYTSGALAFQGSCMTICKLSNIFIN